MKFHIDTNKVIAMQSEKAKQKELKKSEIVQEQIIPEQPLLDTLLYSIDKEMENIVCENLNKYTPYEEYIVNEEILNDYYDFQKRTYAMFYDDNDITMEQFISFIQDCIKFEPLDMTLEAAGRNMTRNAQKKLRKINNKVNGKRNTVTKNLRRLDDKASDVVNRKLDSIINTGRDLAREKIVEGRPAVKISRFIRNGIMALADGTGAVSLLGPAAAAVIVAIGLYCKRNLTKKLKSVSPQICRAERSKRKGKSSPESVVPPGSEESEGKRNLQKKK